MQNCFRPVAANTLSLKHSEHSRVATSPHRQHSLGPARETRVQRECLLQFPPKIHLILPKLRLKEEESQPREPRAGCSQPTIHHSLSSSRSVISSSKEGMILLNILYSFPKRGIWIMKQDGIWGGKKKKKRKGVTLPEEPNPRDFSLILLSLFTGEKENRESRGLFLSHAWIQCWI